MDLQISLDGDGDLAARIYRALRDGVRDGQLRPGDRLPSTRELARQLGVARNTVGTAFERLTAEGYVEGRVGAGTFVTGVAATDRRRRVRPSSALRPREGWTYEPQPTSASQPVPPYDFRVGIPDAGLFPFDTWRRLLTSEVRLQANSPGTYADPAGHRGLREAVARSVGYGRSVRADPDDVLVTSGTQALDLVARVLLTPGDVVAVEEPGYPPARDLLASLGARVVGVPVDDEGLVVDALPERARLVHVTPSHQFPLGTAMSLRRRRALLAWAARRGAAVVEDDYDSEFRFSPRPLEPLHSLDTDGRVLYLGTFSKTLLPALRIGYLVAPPGLRAALRAAKQLTDGHTPVATQAALARFMDEGQLGRHVRRASKAYGERHAMIVSALTGDLADELDLVPSAAGLHVCAWLRRGGPERAERVVAAARREGVVLESLGQYHAGTPIAGGLVIGYGATRSTTVSEGISRLAAVLRRDVQAP